MKAYRLILIAPLMALGATATARTIDVGALARQTGLTERQVRMVLGAPSSFAEYRTSYWIAERRVSQALSGGYEEREPPPHRAAQSAAPAQYAPSAHLESDRPAAQVAPYRETEQRLRVENVDDDDGDDSDEH